MIAAHLSREQERSVDEHQHERLIDQFERFYNGSRDNPALDPKTKALIGFSVVLTGNCQP
jgi:hypothetical protein